VRGFRAGGSTFHALIERERFVLVRRAYIVHAVGDWVSVGQKPWFSTGFFKRMQFSFRA
jgi:hypothetical protein